MISQSDMTQDCFAKSNENTKPSTAETLMDVRLRVSALKQGR